MIYSFAFDDFSKTGRVGPVTQDERLRLIAIYAPYLVIPIFIILTMLVSNNYTYGHGAPKGAADAKSTQSKKKSHYKSH